MNNKTIFDAIDLEKNTPYEGTKGFIEYVSDNKSHFEPKEKRGFLSTLGDYGKSAVKGIVEGGVDLLEALNPQMALDDEGNPYILESQILPKVTEYLDENLPTEDGYVESSIRRGLKQAPTAIAFPGASLAATLSRSLLSGFLGEGVKELGGSENAQLMAELTAYIGPDVTKKLLEKGKNKEIIQAAKALGLSDEAITPLIQSEAKQAWLSKLSPKRGFTQKSLSRAHEELKNAYSNIEKSSAAKGVLPEKKAMDVVSKIETSMVDMPFELRAKIAQDFQDLVKQHVSGQSLINFYGDLNYSIGNKTKQLSALKPIIKDALKNVSPDLAKDFETINQLYSRFYKISSRLKPTIASDITHGLLNASEAIATLTALTTGHYPFLTKIAGEKVIRKLAQHMLLNPRFQQLGEKIVDAAVKNKGVVSLKAVKLLAKEVEKDSPEIANQLRDLTEEDLEELKDIFSRPKERE